MKPLHGFTILEFCQYMAGPLAGLRLADLGARVIKIERPLQGEGGRKLSLKNIFLDGDSLEFHTINRNKESFAVNLKDEKDIKLIQKLIKGCDVIIHNFRPGIMEKLNLDYKACQSLNSKIIYAEISGYGQVKEWKNKPGQDLLIQSISGLTHLTGKSNDPPIPFGIAVADILCGNQLVQGILAALIRRSRNNIGCLIQISLLETTLDLQFEVITTYLNNGRRLPKRSSSNIAHAYLAAPYGIYKTSDSYLALAMVELPLLAETIGCNSLLKDHYIADSFLYREEISEVLSNFLKEHSTRYWLDILEAKQIWASRVLNYEELTKEQGYQCLNIEQWVAKHSSRSFKTTRCPIRIDGKRLTSDRAAPRIGEHNDRIKNEFRLNQST